MIDNKSLTPEQLHLELESSGEHLLPASKKWRPSVLGEHEKEVIEYLKVLRVNGGCVNSTIVRGVAHAVMNCSCPEKLAENGGNLTFTSEWAKKWLARKGWSKRKGTTSKAR